MTLEQFWNQLLDSGDLILATDEPLLGNLAAALRDAADDDGLLIVERAHADFDTMARVISFNGQCSMLGRKQMIVRGQFQFSDSGDLRAFFLRNSASDMDGWKLSQAWPALPKRKDAFYAKSGHASVFNGTGKFVRPRYVISAGRPEITIAGRKHFLDDGLHVVADSLAEELPSKPRYLEAIRDDLPAAFLAAISGKPKIVKARLGLRAPQPFLVLDCWWDPPALGSQWPPEECVWLAKANEIGLRLRHQTNPRVEAIAEFGFGPVASAIVEKRMVFEGAMEPPAILSRGVTELLAITRTSGLNPPRGPAALSTIPVFLQGVERMTVAPSSASATVAMLDPAGKPVSMDPFNGIFQVRNLGYVLSFENKPEDPVVMMTWTGTAMFGDLGFRVSFIGDTRFDASLESPRDVDPLRAVTAFLGGSGPDLPSFPFKLQGVEVSGEKAEDHSIDYSFSIGLAGELDLTAGAKALVLREAGMRIDRSTRKDSGTTVSMGGVATIGGAELSVWGTRIGGAEKGWEFDARIGFGESLPMTGLVDDLLHKWGSSLPSFVPKADLNSLALSYSTIGKTLKLAASTTFEIPGDVPWTLPGTHQAGFELTSRQPPGKGRSTDINVTWNHTIKSGNDEYRFDGFLFASKAEQNFVLDYDGTGADGKGNATIGLANLTKLLNLGVDLPFGAGKWAIFNFNRITIGFDRAGKKKSFFLSASTRLHDDVDLQIEASLGGKSPMFSLKWDPPAEKPDATIGLRDLFTAFGLTPPEGNDILGAITSTFLDIFTFRSVNVRYSHRPQPTLVFMARSACAGYRELMIGTARGSDGHWGQVLCLTFPPESTLLSLFDAYRVPGIQQLLDMIHPEWVMICTVDRFDLPEGDGTISRGSVTPPQFVDSEGKTSTPFGTSRMKIRKGFSVAGYVDFAKAARDTVAGIIHDRFHLDIIRGRVTVNTSGVEFEAMLTGGVDKKTGKALPGGFSLSTGKAFDLTLRDASIALLVERGLVGGSVRGACEVNLFGQKGSYELDLTVSTSGIDGRLHVISTPKLPGALADFTPGPKLSVPALPGVTFHDDYWVDVGIVFEPPGFKFGISSDFHIGADPAQYKGHVDIVLDLEGPVPNPIYLAARIDKLDLWAMFEAQYAVGKRLDQARHGVDAVLGDGNRVSATFEELQHHWENLQRVASILTLRDASFHWCETVVPLPDGTVAQPGVGFQGTLDIAGWTAYGMFEFTSSPFSLMADLELSPLRLRNVLSITGDGKGVTRNGKLMVEAGGPVFHVDSGKSPYLHANLHVSLFEVVNVDVLANVTNDGFEFQLQANAGEVAHLDLGCFLKTRGGVHFQSHGTFRLHVDLDLDPAKYLHLPEGVLGTFHFDAGLDAHFTLDLSPTDFRFVVGGSFDFEGATLTMPELTIDVPFGNLKDLAIKIVEHIKDKALEIFSEIWDVLKKGFKIVGEFVVHTAQVAYEEAKVIVGAVAEEAKKVYHELEEGAKQLVGAAAEKAEQVCSAVSKAVEQFASEAIAEAAELGRKAFEQAKKLAEAAEQVFSAAVDTAKKIGAAVAAEVVKIAGEIAHAVEEAARKIAELAAEAARFAKHLVDGAIELAKAIAREAEEIVKGIEHAIGALWDEINALIRRAAEAVRDAALAVAHGVESVVNAIGSC